MRHRAVHLFLALLLLTTASPAWAAREWYVHYEEAQKAAARGRCREALDRLREAVALKPRSGLQQQTYGLEFVDYLPYYHQGVCHLRLNEHAQAVAAFDQEEKQGAIRGKPTALADLVKQRAQAESKDREAREAAEQQRRMAAASEEVQRLRREGDELYRAGKLEEALARLASAQTAAEILNPSLQEQIRDRVQKIRQEAAQKAEHAARAERIEKALEAGRRLLQEKKPAEAKIRFDEVLEIEPRNAAAVEGRRLAEEEILAFTTQQERAALLAEGRRLMESGEHQKALKPLTEAAADPDNAEAQELLSRVRRTLENVREQKEQRVRIDELLARAERLLETRKFPEAMVALNDVLRLDPEHPRARESLTLAERQTSREIIDRILPNQQPELIFLQAPPPEIEARSVAMVGVASDDRGLARIEYRLGDQVVAEQALEPDRETRDFPRSVRITQVFPLEPGINQVSIVLLDTSGVLRVERFTIDRKLRFYETRAFMPSAVAGAFTLVGAGYAAQRARRRRAVRRRFNPYIAGAPVLHDDMFFGRQKLLARILNVLHHNSLMITGERRIGKTTFLYRLKRALETDEGTDYRFFPVFTDLQGVTEEGLFHAVMSDVVDTLRLTPETLAGLRFRTESEEYDGRDFSHDLQRVVEELKARTPRKVKLALLIDEADALNGYSERINQRLRGIFMKTFSEHLVAIMSGVGVRRAWTSEGSPWYNFFDEIELTPFTREEAEALIRQPVEGVFRWQPEAVEAILTLSELKPYVIQKYCIHAVNRMLEHDRSTVTLADVEAVREDVQYEGRPAPRAARRQQASA